MIEPPSGMDFRRILSHEVSASGVDVEQSVEKRLVHHRNWAEPGDGRVNKQHVNPTVIGLMPSINALIAMTSLASDAMTSIPGMLTRAASRVVGFEPVTITFAPSP
jgi:hypothetical protein